MDIYIIRHGETDANKNGVLQGWSDFDINEYGVELAVASGRGMKGIVFDAAYSSDLTRAKHTAELVLEHSGNPDVEIIIDKRIREVDMGDWELKPISSIDMTQMTGFLKDPLTFEGCPNGESIPDLCERTQAFLHDLAGRDYKNVLVATHGTALRAMLNFLYENPQDFWHGNVPYNCVVNVVHADENGQMTLIEDDKFFYDIEKYRLVDRYKDY